MKRIKITQKELKIIVIIVLTIFLSLKPIVVY